MSAQGLPPDPPAEIIVVTGRALAQARAEAAVGSVVIDERQLANAPATGLERVIGQVAGVQLFRRSDARSANPTSQGVTLRALGGNAASRVLLTLDGVPQTDPFGGWIAWPAYDPPSLSEVRVTRGGGGVTDGPGALGGTIALTSTARPGVAARVEGGSHGSGEASLIGGAPIGAGVLTLALRGARGNGFTPIVAADRGAADRPAPYRNAAGRLRWVVPLAPATELQANLSAFNDRRERGLEFTGNRSRGVDASLRAVGRGRWGWSLLGYVQRRDFLSSFGAADESRSEARLTALQYDVPGRAVGFGAELRPPLPTGFELRFGADGRLMQGRSDEFGSYVAGLPTRDRRSGGRTAHAGLFAEGSWTQGLLTLSAAGRIDRWRIADGEFVDRSLLTGATLTDLDYRPRGGWRPTGRAGAVVDLGSGLEARAAAYLGWRLPTLNELFRPFRLGLDATAANPELDRERLRGAELGLSWRHDPLKVSLTGFVNRLLDPIANVTLARGPGSFPGVGFVPQGGDYRQRLNLEATRSRGLEANADWRVGPWLATVSTSLTSARVEASGIAAPLDGLRPAQTPRFVSAASLGWQREGRTATLSARYTGAQWEDDRNTQRLPGGLTVDALAAVPLTTHLQLTGRAENLFNKPLLAAISADGTRERITPRTLWIGLRWARQPG